MLQMLLTQSFEMVIFQELCAMGSMQQTTNCPNSYILPILFLCLVTPYFFNHHSHLQKLFIIMAIA
jgi:hypothetical protein